MEAGRAFPYRTLELLGHLTTLEANGADSELDLADLTSITDTSYSDTIEVLDGGTVNLSSLTTMTANVDLEAQGSGSELNISELTRFAASGSSVDDAFLTAEDGAAVDSGRLTTLNGLTLTISDTASISLGQLEDINTSSVVIERRRSSRCRW